MTNNYQYPLDMEWTKEDIVAVMAMWQTVEAAYEQGVDVPQLLEVYRKFKKVVPSIGEERALSREFEELSGYSLFRVMQQGKTQQIGKIKL